jgi:predicted AAA+ superfamily ATPase
MIKRLLFDIIKDIKKKAVIVLGPRQTGKTTLLKELRNATEDNLWLDCDDPIVREQLENANIERLRQITGINKTIFIDEAQRVKNIGLTLKMITDNFSDKQLYVSGSSSLELSNEINEPLTGRKQEYMLYPLSWEELYNHYGYIKSLQQLENRIIYGMYPEVVTNPGKEKELLREIMERYLYKDILSYKGIRKPDLLRKLLQALAFQTGNEVSYNKLANSLQVDKKTISTYIELLEKTFVIFRLNPLSRNLRNEISTNRKIYFYDTGIRNAIIANFNPLCLRQDTGALWENFIISERQKFIHYHRVFCNVYFWRTRQQKEIDYIEERDGKLFTYEIKWNPDNKYKIPASFINNYPNSKYSIINKDNFNDLLLYE